jgi:hypothetical protein
MRLCDGLSDLLYDMCRLQHTVLDMVTDANNCCKVKIQFSNKGFSLILAADCS